MTRDQLQQSVFGDFYSLRLWGWRRQPQVSVPPAKAGNCDFTNGLQGILMITHGGFFCPRQKPLFYQGVSVISDNHRWWFFLPTGTWPIHARDAQKQGFTMVSVCLRASPGASSATAVGVRAPRPSSRPLFYHWFSRDPDNHRRRFFLPMAKPSFYQ